MRTPPADLDPAALVAAVRAGWGVELRTVEHRPVGFGSHHWVADDGVDRWWITVDDLGDRRSAGPGPDEAFADLRAAMATSRALGDAGCPVVAPVRRVDGEPIVRLDERHAVVVHPFVDGVTHEWGDDVDPADRARIVDVLAELHQVPLAAVPDARFEGRDFGHRDALERAASGVVPADDDVDAMGPYAAGAARLARRHRVGLAGALARFDRLLDGATGGAGETGGRLVPTHGEPHPGNLIEVDGRWVLIDWDTVRIAPPERDLWMLVGSDAYPTAPEGAAGGFGPAGLVARYEAATGTRIDTELLAAYRLRWDLADAASYLHRFASPHAGTADDDEAWTNLRRSVAHLTGASPTGA